MLVVKAVYPLEKLVCSKGQEVIFYIFLQMLIVQLLVYSSWPWGKCFQ